MTADQPVEETRERLRRNIIATTPALAEDQLAAVERMLQTSAPHLDATLQSRVKETHDRHRR